MISLQTLQSFYGNVPPRLAFPLLIAPFLLSLGDFGLTLHFQPEPYWNGDRSVVVEANPVVRSAMSIHPLLLIPGFVGWYALVFPLIFKTPAWFGLRVHVFLVLGHLVMISGWLLRKAEDGGVSSLVVLAISLPFAWLIFSPFRAQWESGSPVRLPES